MKDLITYKNYIAEVHYSNDDEVFHGKVLGINDLVTFEGQSVKELKKAFKEAVEDYLLTCAEMGRTPDKTYKGSLNVRLNSQLHKSAAIAAARNNLSLNDFIKKAVTYAVKHEDEI
jgi:predicted HicB family RNase H-like nuclease